MNDRMQRGGAYRGIDLVANAALGTSSREKKQTVGDKEPHLARGE
jgi:hypothetical protein